MDIEKAAKQLKLSQRHIRRLIENGTLPAKRVKKLVEVEVWDINDKAIEAAFKTIRSLVKYENFYEWMLATMKELGIKFPELSQRTKLPIMDIVTDDVMIGKLNSVESELRDRIIMAIVRVALGKRDENADK